jgi:hypothetical protein
VSMVIPRFALWPTAGRISAMANGLTSELSENCSSNAPAICVVASCIPFLMLATIIVLRSGYPTPVRALVEMVGLSLLIVNVSGLVQSKRWYACGFACSLYALLFLTGLGLLAFPAARSLVTVLAALGVMCFAANLLRTFQGLGSLATLGLLGLGLFLGLYMESFYWSAQHEVLYPEGIVAGAVHIDVAEQTAIVSMISTYGVPSTGLTGLVRLRYHNGAFWIGEALRKLCRISAIEFIAFGYGIVVIPFYIAMFVEFAAALRSSLRTSPAALPLGAWFIAAAVIIGLVPHEDNLVRANYNVLIINSDSFMLGLALVFLFGGIAAALYQSHPRNLLPDSLAERLALAAAIPGALILIGFVKITLMYSALAVLLYLWWRVRSLRHWAFTSGLAASAVALFVMLRAETGANLSKVILFNFDRVHPEWIPYFFLFHFAWAWILAVVWAVHYKVRTLSEIRQAFQSKLSLPLELVVVAAITGLIPYFVLYFNSGSWVYFTLFHALLAGGFILALQPRVSFAQIRGRLADGSLPLSAAVTFALVLIVAGHLIMATVGSAYRMLKRDGEVRALLTGKESSDWGAGLREIAHPGAVTDLRFINRSRVLECLTEISRRPKGQREATVLYIPKTNRWYWDMRQSDTGATPFIAPAFSGLAMVEGLPEYDDIGYAAIAWGYPQYQLPTGPEPPRENLDEAITDAKKDGFRELLVFRDVNSSGCQMNEIGLD